VYDGCVRGALYVYVISCVYILYGIWYMYICIYHVLRIHAKYVSGSAADPNQWFHIIVFLSSFAYFSSFQWHFLHLNIYETIIIQVLDYNLICLFHNTEFESCTLLYVRSYVIACKFNKSSRFNNSLFIFKCEHGKSMAVLICHFESC